MNPMNEVKIEKATISIGVGEAGEKLWVKRFLKLLIMFTQVENLGNVG